ncbi:MAG: hypothetical protein GSR72_07645 [Desulfurococcales archaeon]|nr:hypothetical protein [Desulfurococcales archaeon]
MTETAIVSRLESILDAMPKEGMRAAIVQGVVERVKEMIEEALKAQNYITCLANARGYCKENYCNPKCSHIYMDKTENATIIGKFYNNPIGIELKADQAAFKTQDIKMTVASNGTITVEYPNGEKVTIETTNMNSVYKNNYIIKYAIRKIGRPLRILLEDLVKCARENAIVC